VAAGQGPQPERGRGRRGGDRTRFQLGGGPDQPHRGQAAPLLAQLLGRGDHQRLERVDGWVRAFIAVARATRSERTISTCPVTGLGDGAA
jgi:hypothetical protein